MANVRAQVTQVTRGTKYILTRWTVNKKKKTTESKIKMLNKWKTPGAVS